MPKTVVTLTSPDNGYSADYLGGKGFNLWRMKQAGVNVPPAVIIPTDVCREYMSDPAAVEAWVRDEAIPVIMSELSSKAKGMPLVSVRSGAKFSMPGMLSTILNVGLCSATAGKWYDKLGASCAENCTERLATMYADVVGDPLPDNVADQLYGSIIAVFQSWNNDRAITYRNLNKIPHDLGTAVIVQEMVFGNLNDQSATGVAFSRNFSTGINEVLGEFLINAQGEDVVDGSHTPLPLSELGKWNPFVFNELMATMSSLEAMNQDMQDVEFTVQDAVLYILQTRNAKRTAQAAVRIAVDLYEEGLISKEVAVTRVTKEQILAASRPALDPAWLKANPPHAIGLPASNGVVTGKPVFSAEEAVAVGGKGPVILVSLETTPDDLAGMAASVGILTARGGKTSHAAVVARAMDKVAVVGCDAVKLIPEGAYLVGNDGVTHTFNGLVTIDGASGSVWINVEPKMIGGATGPVREFLKMLSEVYGYWEVAVDSDSIVNPDKVVFPAFVMGVADFEVEVLKMAASVKELIIDLRDPIMDPVSAPLNSLWGQPESDTISKVMALVSNPLPNVKLIVDSQFAISAKLAGTGYEVVPIISTWDDLNAATGMVVADHVALENAIKAKIPTIIKQKAAAGKKVFSLNCVSEIDREALKRGVVFAALPINAALSLLD